MLDACRMTPGSRFLLEHHFTTLRWSIGTDYCSFTSQSIMLAEEERFLCMCQITITQALQNWTRGLTLRCLSFLFGFGGYYNKFECKNHRHFGLSLSGFFGRCLTSDAELQHSWSFSFFWVKLYHTCFTWSQSEIFHQAIDTRIDAHCSMSHHKC